MQHRFMETGRMDQRGVVETLAPAMDIQISSNFERCGLFCVIRCVMRCVIVVMGMLQRFSRCTADICAWFLVVLRGFCCYGYATEILLSFCRRYMYLLCKERGCWLLCVIVDMDMLQKF